MDSARKNTIETTKKTVLPQNATTWFSEGFFPNTVITIRSSNILSVGAAHISFKALTNTILRNNMDILYIFGISRTRWVFLLLYFVSLEFCRARGQNESSYKGQKWRKKVYNFCFKEILWTLRLSDRCVLGLKLKVWMFPLQGYHTPYCKMLTNILMMSLNWMYTTV